ncbi:sugar ABC transporter [Actinomycetes bacterium]|nr:sugar ABC transporter [Actinomycetes bacterium]
MVYPISQAIWTSLTDKTLGAAVDEKINFVGLRNYNSLLHSPTFLASLRITTTYALLNVVFSVGAGLLTAILVNKKFRGRGGIRALMTAPWAFPDIASVIIFIWILNSAFGVVGILNQHLPFDTSGGWLTSSPYAFVSIIVMSMWKTFPFYSIVFLAALQGVPEDLTEAATVDGAGPFQRFKTVTLPSIRPTFVLLALLAFIFAFRQFSMIYLTTGGGPERDTETLVLAVYNTAFKYYDLALSSAIGVVGLIFTFLIAVAFLALQSRAEKSNS